MARRAQRLDSHRRKPRPTSSHNARSRNVAPRLNVAAVEELHLTVDYRSLCGLLTVEQVDVYQDEAGWRAWNNSPLEQAVNARPHSSR
jgi:hypothetical protein